MADVEVDNAAAAPPDFHAQLGAIGRDFDTEELLAALVTTELVYGDTIL
ncbi:hypothetical protein THITH_09825 [Thioalkalivibrio paradoxus ARh 1]|uniref:Uncharacterized protein n=1 Tax=Thioalkalivibrio paradoxus ARh 1 TaxID=713585 RepID=W0DTA7_9GAMM|nr:hypothetical protein THITH_09825 [Thioalkalivibrio paradoxus ARh 1]